MLGQVAVIFALVLLNGILAGSEIAVISVRKTRLRERVEEGSPSARAVLALRAEPERFLATVQIGITVVGAAAGAFGGATIAGELVDPLRALGFGALAEDVAFLLVVGGISYLALVGGELVPKSLALRYAEVYSLAMGRPLRAAAWVMRPAVWFLTASSNVVLKGFGDSTTFSESRLSTDELQQLVEEATKAGNLDPRIGAIASRAFDFSDVPVSAVMVPRAEVVAMPKSASAEEIKRLLLDKGHSRMPVYDGGLDTIAGYVIAKDLVTLAWHDPSGSLDKIVRPAYFVPETVPAVRVLQELQERRTQLAIVVDEMGSVAGLVTIEDLVEELVGEIFHEQESPPELASRDDDGSLVVQGVAPIRDLNRDYELDLPEGDAYSTVAGLCIQLADRLPPPGTRLALQSGTALEVLETSARRVRTVRIHPAPRREAV